MYRADPSVTGKRLHRCILEDTRTRRGLACLSRSPSSCTPRRRPDFMKDLMQSELLHMKSMSLRKPVPLRPITPLVGRDASGCLRLFSPTAVERMSSQGPGGWHRQAAYDGLSSSQRGFPPLTKRYGPGPDQVLRARPADRQPHLSR